MGCSCRGDCASPWLTLHTIYHLVVFIVNSRWCDRDSQLYHGRVKPTLIFLVRSLHDLWIFTNFENFTISQLIRKDYKQIHVNPRIDTFFRLTWHNSCSSSLILPSFCAISSAYKKWTFSAFTCTYREEYQHANAFGQVGLLFQNVRSEVIGFKWCNCLPTKLLWECSLPIPVKLVK